MKTEREQVQAAVDSGFEKVMASYEKPAEIQRDKSPQRKNPNGDWKRQIVTK